jgi:hypothetical protein
MNFILDIIRNGSTPERILWALTIFLVVAAILRIRHERRCRVRKSDPWARGNEIVREQAKLRESDRFRGDGGV